MRIAKKKKRKNKINNVVQNEITVSHQQPKIDSNIKNNFTRNNNINKNNITS